MLEPRIFCFLVSEGGKPPEVGQIESFSEVLPEILKSHFLLIGVLKLVGYKTNNGHFHKNGKYGQHL
jgi:hypothetical protein